MMLARRDRIATFIVLTLGLTLTTAVRAEITLDERPAQPGEWGYRPAEGSEVEVNPPSFSWRPQQQIVRWELECRSVTSAGDPAYRVTVEGMNVHCPPNVFSPGRYTWRYRGARADGETTNWSQLRRFVVPEGVASMPMPSRDELLARIPTAHPRLFVRPEELPRLRELAAGPMRAQYDALVRTCERLVKSPPPTVEPPKYPAGTVRGSEQWRVIWWGNREYTIDALNGAATLAFTRLLGGKEEYGRLAKRILLDCARWDPKGATGYRYNDEAGMPYNYYFVRTYTFVWDLLSEQERELCRQVIKVRGEEMYRHLYPRHLWQPYSSHSNRAWHFLGEVGVAMLGEVEGAEDWVWFAMNVFYNTYPVWSDADGGWHEGSSYWSSYINRFTWWADVMRSAMDVNAYDKPYFSQIGYYPMYLLPPGKVGGGFGDLTARRTARSGRQLVSQLAVQASNGHWQWYVDQLGGSQAESGYIGFVRGVLPEVAPTPPDDLPSSRLFAGTGQAMLNTSLEDARESVQVVFKSSPFGTWSHGYEANNSFLLWAYGQRLLIRSGYRDIYGSKHHKEWMWSTRSVNNITVNGQGQLPHSQASQGEIIAFHTSPTIDYVVGEAGTAYRDKANASSQLDQFTRAVLFVKPDLVVVYDRLGAKSPSSFEYWLHATNKFAWNDQRDVQLQVDDVNCRIELLAPGRLVLSQTDQYDPNPRPRITLREWHLTAATPDKARQTEFVTVFRPYRKGMAEPGPTTLNVDGDCYRLTALTAGGRVTIGLPKTGASDGRLVIERRDADGATERVVVQR